MSTIIKADASGTVTLPAELCQAAGVTPGTDLVAEIQAGRIVLECPRLPIWQRIAAGAAETPPGRDAQIAGRRRCADRPLSLRPSEATGVAADASANIAR